MLGKRHGSIVESAYLEALVLEYALDGSVLARGRQLGLKHDAKGSIAHNLALGILHISSLTGDAILNLLADDFCTKVMVSCQCLYRSR